MIALVPGVGPSPEQCESLMEGVSVEEPASFAELEGVSDVAIDGRTLRCTVVGAMRAGLSIQPPLPYWSPGGWSLTP